MGVSVAAIAPRSSVRPFRSICVMYVSVAPWFGTGLTFFRELCYLTVVAFQRQGIISIIIIIIMLDTGRRGIIMGRRYVFE